MRMQKFLTALIVAMVTVVPGKVFAAHPQKVEDLVRPYVKAFREFNRVEIRKLHARISSQEDVLTYINENMPDTLRLYNAWKMVEWAEDLNARYGSKDIRDDYVPGARITADSTTGRTFPSNKTIVNGLRNQDLPSNQSRVTNASINSNRISNSRIAQSFSNSRQTSNRDRINASRQRR